ncbi:hypothetical protein SAMN04515621_2789 [Erythrobacter sp. HL-111]|nr:MAG: Membrane domain of glycerophosphoryl diester phosphodiesterase [Erythrobacteraceae bacterium HL-111]SDT04497.1 hypothetical protein SAMN04515621_2789 [Erythrobacter sp. HL-111]
MGKAWNDAMALLSANFGVIATVVGLFYFLPQFAVAILAPGTMEQGEVDLPDDATPEMVIEAMSAAFQEAYTENWPFLLLTVLLGYVGALAVLALLRRGGNPTVGEALRAGAIGTPSYFATQILFAIGAGLVFGLPVALVAAVAPIGAAFLALLLLVVLVYAAFKLILVPAVIGIESELNPFAVIARSWRLTKGNTLRIFVFLVLLFIVITLITVIVTLVFTLVFSAMGDEVERIGNGFVGALANAATGAIFLTVLAAIHRQLSGDGERVAETFE